MSMAKCKECGGGFGFLELKDEGWFMQVMY